MDVNKPTDDLYIKSIEDEIRKYNRDYGRGLNFVTTSKDAITSNVSSILSMLEGRTNQFPSKEEHCYACALLHLILTLPAAQMGFLNNSRLRMVIRVKRIHFIRRMSRPTTDARSWSQLKAMAVLIAAIDMYHSTEPERKWWANAHEFINRLALIRDLIHQDLFIHFLGLVWRILCGGLGSVTAVSWVASGSK